MRALARVGAESSVIIERWKGKGREGRRGEER